MNDGNWVKRHGSKIHHFLYYDNIDVMACGHMMVGLKVFAPVSITPLIIKCKKCLKKVSK